MDFINEFIRLLQQSQSTAVIVFALLGLCVGSFLNVVIYRTPQIMHREWRKESAQFWQHESDLAEHHKLALAETVSKDTPMSLSFPPSRCPNCNHQIRWYENIPVMSWLLLRGKCSDCHNLIGLRYPLVELITAVLSVLVIVTFGVTWQGVSALLLVWLLIALAGIDFNTQFLPDRFTLPLAGLGLFVNAFGVFVSPVQAILGYVIGFLCLWVVAYLYCLLRRREGMGVGDFKLLAALGAWLGPWMLPLIILLSSLLGSLVGLRLLFKRKESQPFAFGPYIAMAGVIALLYGKAIMAWYLGSMV